MRLEKEMALGKMSLGPGHIRTGILTGRFSCGSYGAWSKG